MNKQNITKFLQSFVAIPMLAVATPLIGVTPMTSAVVLSQNTVAVETSTITTPEVEIRKKHADEIDAFLVSRNAPLAGYGDKFVEEAEENGLDYRLLPAIAVRETGAGKEPCKNPKAPNNNFGWASCKKGFSSVDASIEHIAKTLGGNNTNVRHYKDDMTTDQILKKYNPDSIIPGYSKQVIKIMKMINNNEEIV